MLNFSAIKQTLLQAGMPAWADVVEGQLEQVFVHTPHGDLSKWQNVLEQIPAIATETIRLNQGLVQIGSKADSTVEQREQLQALLQQLHPWRKGPYLLHGVMVDTEWRSDWKWDRLAPHIEPLSGRKVLDVGCGNGYHCWRMAGEGAEWVLGIDPSQFFFMQFQAVRKLLLKSKHVALDVVHHLPLGIEAVPQALQAFDSVFSMGVLYHRRSPIEHLQMLQGCLKPRGQLILETLVVDGDAQQVLVPQGRYAKMRNVWFIPSVAMLETWLRRCGYQDVRTIDVSATTTQEQRSTDWMRFESLPDYLDPNASSRTIEGYPAPKRAITLAVTP